MTQPAPQQQPITNATEAERAIANLYAIMDSLIETVEQETAHAGAGKMFAAIAFDQTKADLARRYAAETLRLKTARDIVSRSLPAALEALRKRHATFQALLQKNLTVLATAHAVGEGIIRGVAGEMNRQQSPAGYGASGRASAPNARTAQPLAVCKSL